MNAPVPYGVLGPSGPSGSRGRPATRPDSAGGVPMIGWKSGITVLAVAVLSFAGISGIPAEGATRPATGVGSCTLKNWNPSLDPDDAKDLPEGDRPQTYKPDDYDCTGATFASDGVEFAKFPQPGNFHVTNRPSMEPVQVCQAGACTTQNRVVSQPVQASNPLAPYFPPF